MWRVVMAVPLLVGLQGCCCSCCGDLIPSSVGDQLAEQGAEAGLVWLFEQAGARDVTVDLDTEGGGMHVETHKGTMDVHSTNPSTEGLMMPVVESATPGLVGKVEQKDGTARVHHLQFSSTGDPKESLAFYESWAADQGYTTVDMDTASAVKELQQKTAEGLVPIPDAQVEDMDVDVDYSEMADNIYVGVKADGESMVYVMIGDDGEGSVHVIEGGKAAAQMLFDELDGGTVPAEVPPVEVEAPN